MPSKIVVTFSLGCTECQSPSIVWLLAFGPVTKIRFLDVVFFNGKSPWFFNKTIPF